MRLDGQVAIITGAARGIGKGIARRFLDEGARVLIADVRAEGVEQAVADLTVFGEVAGVVTDVRQRDQIEAMIESAVNRWGQLDILVNNAGIAHTTPFLDISDADWDRILDTNLRGTFLGCQIAGRQMVKQGSGGSLINIASTNGLRGQPMLADYGASKAGIINLTKTIALELGRQQIRANAICPGTIWNEMSAEAGLDEAVWDEMRAQTALNTFGTPEDIAAAAAYLASDDARFVTGSVLVVDGGITSRQLFVDAEQIRHRQK